MAQNIFGSDGGPAVPGGSVAKPLIIALLALLASRYFGGGKKQDTAPAEAPRAARIRARNRRPTPGSILDGLGGLIKQFQQKGLGDAIELLGRHRQEQERRSRPGFRGARRRRRRRTCPAAPGCRAIKS